MGRMKKRSYQRDILEIAAAILYEATGGATRQKIMTRVFLSFVQARRYLSLLVTWGFLEYQQDTKTFRITPRGTAYLDAFDNVRMMVVT